MNRGKRYSPSRRKHQIGGRGEKKQTQPALDGAEERRTQDIVGAGGDVLSACLGFASATLRHQSRQEHMKRGKHQHALSAWQFQRAGATPATHQSTTQPPTNQPKSEPDDPNINNRPRARHTARTDAVMTIDYTIALSRNQNHETMRCARSNPSFVCAEASQ
jgi:hypothetical protein